MLHLPMIEEGDRRAVVKCEGGSARGRQRGFTLLEILVVMTIVAIIMALGFPALQQQIVRSKLTGAANETSVHLYQARVEAMKLARQIVVMPDYANRRLVGFVDENEDLLETVGEAELFSVPMQVAFMGPDGVAGTESSPGQSVDGLTAIGGGSNLRVAVFEPDGSIRDSGAFRLSDDRDPVANTVEVRIAPAATARVEVRKYLYGGPSGDGFYSSGGGTWKWY